MKEDHHPPPGSKMKATFSALHPPKSKSMSKNRGTPSKTEQKRSLVAIRLAMLQRDIDAISNEPPPPPPFEPSTPFKSANLKRVDESREESSRHSKSSAMQRAEEVQASLSSQHPSFIRAMLHSHVAASFWLGLSKTFCNQHFPTSDTMMELIDESGKSFHAKYLATKTAFSGGWRGFSIVHNLEEGDVLVFQLIKKTTLKVYIIRRNALGETDGATGLQDLEAFEDVLVSNDGETDDNAVAKAQEQHPDSCLPASGGKEDEKTLSGSPDREVVDWIRRSKSVNLEGFGKFSILLDGSVSIDAKFPEDIRRKYYDICSEQNLFLHEKLQKGLNCTLVVGIINETINISDAIRARDCNTQVPQSDLLAWDRTMQSFQLVGMNVHFIRAQIHQLIGRTLEHEEAAALEAKAESELAGKRMKTLEGKLLELRKQMEEINEGIKMTQESTQRSRVKLQQMTSSSCGGFGLTFVD